MRLDQGRGHGGPAAPRGHCISRGSVAGDAAVAQGRHARGERVRFGGAVALDVPGSDRCVSPGRSTGYSERDLHANAIATPTAALIGSANASAHSRDLALEASIITDSQDIIDQLREFVEGLADESKRVTAADLPRLQKLWDEGESNDPRRAVPGVNQYPEGLIQDFTAGFALNEWSPHHHTRDDRKANGDVRKTHRDPSIGVDWLILDKEDPGYDVGTVQFVIDKQGIEPPG